MPEPVQSSIEIDNRRKSQSPLTEFATPYDFRGQQWRRRISGKEIQLLTHRQLASGTNQRTPLQRGVLISQQNFDASLQVFPRRWVPRADWLRMNAGAAREQSRRQHAGVVQHQQIAGPQQRWEIAEPVVLERSHVAVKNKHARGSAIRKRLLGNPFRRQKIIEIADQRNLSLSAESLRGDVLFDRIAGTFQCSLDRLPRRFSRAVVILGRNRDRFMPANDDGREGFWNQESIP